MCIGSLLPTMGSQEDPQTIKDNSLYIIQLVSSYLILKRMRGKTNAVFTRDVTVKITIEYHIQIYPSKIQLWFSYESAKFKLDIGKDTLEVKVHNKFVRWWGTYWRSLWWYDHHKISLMGSWSMFVRSGVQWEGQAPRRTHLCQNSSRRSWKLQDNWSRWNL